MGILLALGLFFAPQTFSSFWPWALTPLTARALSAWFISFGVLDLISVMEKDWRRLHVTSIGYSVTGFFGLLALIRYADQADQADLSGIVGVGYLIYLLVMLGMGLYGWRMGK